MLKYKHYGNSPFDLVLLHGGPGAFDSLNVFAKELAIGRGVILPRLEIESLYALLKELAALIEKRADHPVSLLGHSFGALVAIALAGAYPQLTKKIILVGCPALQSGYEDQLKINRQTKLEAAQRQHLKQLEDDLDKASSTVEQNVVFGKLGEFWEQVDGVDLLQLPAHKQEVSYQSYLDLWPQAVEWREKGKFVESCLQLQCPVVLIQGDHDSHPFSAPLKTFEEVGIDYTSYLLEKCGHSPWRERQTREEFFRILDQELL
mgnify:CR=1 FL=1